MCFPEGYAEGQDPAEWLLHTNGPYSLQAQEMPKECNHEKNPGHWEKKGPKTQNYLGCSWQCPHFLFSIYLWEVFDASFERPTDRDKEQGISKVQAKIIPHFWVVFAKNSLLQDSYSCWA